MGLNTEFVAVRTHDPRETLRALGLSLPPDEVQVEGELSGVMMPGGWYVIDLGRDNPVDEAVLATLSEQGEIYQFEVYEGPMYAGAARWEGGREHWSVHSYEGQLRATGEPPADLQERTAAAERRSAEDTDEEGWGVDHVFDVPLSFVRDATGYEYSLALSAHRLAADVLVPTTTALDYVPTHWKRQADLAALPEQQVDLPIAEADEALDVDGLAWLKDHAPEGYVQLLMDLAPEAAADTWPDLDIFPVLNFVDGSVGLSARFTVRLQASRADELSLEAAQAIDPLAVVGGAVCVQLPFRSRSDPSGFFTEADLASFEMLLEKRARRDDCAHWYALSNPGLAAAFAEAACDVIRCVHDVPVDGVMAGESTVYLFLTTVAATPGPWEITLDEAHGLDPDAKIGDELGIPVLSIQHGGDLSREPLTPYETDQFHRLVRRELVTPELSSGLREALVEVVRPVQLRVVR